MARTERSGHTTTDHDFIRQWVEDRGGWPARVAGTESGGDDAGLIRVDFPGYSGAGSLERIEWEEWFQKFDESDLAFLHRDMSHGGGDLDRFNKLVKRGAGDNDNESRTSRGRSTRSSGGSRSSSSRSSSRSGSGRSSGGTSTSRSGGAKRTTASRASESSSSSSSGGSKSSGSKSSSRSSGSKSGGSSSRSSGGSSRSAGSKSSSAGKSSSSRSSAGKSSSSRSTASKSSSSGSSRSSSGRSSGSKSSSSGNGSSGGAKSTARKVVAAMREMLPGGNGNGNGGAGEMRELLKHELGDLLFAEKVFLKATKTLAKEAQDPTIKGRVEEHVRETEGQIERLNQAFRAIGEKPKAEKCPAALGLQEEHDSFKSEEKPSKTLLSAFDLGSGLRVEHYEIAAYRTAIAVATAVGEKACADILKENLKEELAMASFLEKSSLGVLRGMARA